ncbi:MAG: hypothetical protein ACJAZO_003789 [Myxococcota bacterium]
MNAEELTPQAREFVRAGVWEDRLEQATQESMQRLGDAFGHMPILVPPVGGGGIPRHVVAQLAVALGRQVGVSRRELPWT